MASGGSAVSADAATVAYLRRFVTSSAELQTIYKAAWAAHQERLTSVTITDVSLEGEGGSGEIAGNPADLMAACEVVLQEIEGERAPGAASLISFRRRRVET